jgi:hypothetical protein
MNRLRLDNTKLAELEALFAVERELVPEPDAISNRAIQRARAALPRTLPLQLVSRSPKPRRLRIGQAATAAVMLSALCAAAFHAGYEMKSRSAAPPASAPTLTPSVLVLAVPVAPSTGSLSTDPELPLAGPRPAKAKPVRSAKPAAAAYAMELRVLQPAQQAAARQDFASALAAIAEHQHRFPSGQLAEEREALRVKALLGLGHIAEARRAGIAFRQRFPRSVLLGRIDKMLGTQR